MLKSSSSVPLILNYDSKEKNQTTERKVKKKNKIFKDVVPITTENFRNLCIGTQNGLTYKNSCVNKIIKDFVLGGGNLENYKGGDKCIDVAYSMIVYIQIIVV